MRYSAPVQTGPEAHRVSCTMGTGPFPVGKERPGRESDPLPPSSAVGHERVDLYLYSPYGPYGLYRASVPVQGCTLLYLGTTLFMSNLNTEVICYSETSEPPTRLHGVTTHKPTLRIFTMAITANAFSAPVHTGGRGVTSTKSRDSRGALEDNRTNFAKRINGRTAREIRNISRHDVRTAVRHFTADTAICYWIAFFSGIYV